MQQGIDIRSIPGYKLQHLTPLGIELAFERMPGRKRTCVSADIGLAVAIALVGLLCFAGTTAL